MVEHRADEEHRSRVRDDLLDRDAGRARSHGLRRPRSWGARSAVPPASRT
jgi:hypothetical protein